MFADALKQAMKTRESPGDYIKDGILHCGRCGEPKEALLSLPALTGSNAPKPFPIVCKCQKEAIEKAKAERLT